jgi:hypothetical protein
MAIQYADLYCNNIVQIIIKLKELFKPGHGRYGLELVTGGMEDEIKRDTWNLFGG